jgi:hypothetical protein
MLIAILFWAMTLTCCGYSAIFGSSDAKIYAGLILSASLLTGIIQYILGINNHNLPIVIMDIFFLLIFYLLALRSIHYWPLWITGFHLLTCLSHLVSFVIDNYIFNVYFGLQAVWAVFGQFFMALGIYLDNKTSFDDKWHNTNLNKKGYPNF